jgi:hypothetical protein
MVMFILNVSDHIPVMFVSVYPLLGRGYTL